MASIPKRVLRYFSESSPDRNRHLIALVIFFTVALSYHYDLLRRFELVTYDYRVMLRGPREADPRIAVIEISDDSVSKIGRWPWDRKWHATIVKILKELGAKAVAFDVIFSEASDPSSDKVMAEALRQAGNVYLAEVIEYSKKFDDKLLQSIPIIAENAKGAGHINLEPDADGVMRRISLMRDLDGQKVPQLSLSIALDEYGVKLSELYTRRNWLHIPTKNGAPLRVPLDRHHNFILNWAGKWQDTFEHFSYVDVVTSYAAWKKGEKPAIDLSYFKGKMCYIGTSATGLFDIRPTPLEPSYPAVGVNLTVLNNLLEKRFILPLGYWQNLLILVLVMLALFPIMRLKSYFAVAASIGALAITYVVVAIQLFIWFSVWINIIYSLAIIVMIYFFVTLYNQLSISIERTKLLKLATRDSLTGLYNIGHFKLLLKAEITTISMRREKALSILMGDVDNFKKTNDTYGHVTGDTVLKEVAAAVKANCRALDVAARYGGEEFILMVPGANADVAYKIADKIRAAVNEKEFAHEKGAFKTSISIGVTQISPDEKDIEEIVKRADRALYQAKQTGKNKVVIASDSPKVAGPPAA